MLRHCRCSIRTRRRTNSSYLNSWWSSKKTRAHRRTPPQPPSDVPAAIKRRPWFQEPPPKLGMDKSWSPVSLRRPLPITCCWVWLFTKSSQTRPITFLKLRGSSRPAWGNWCRHWRLGLQLGPPLGNRHLLRSAIVLNVFAVSESPALSTIPFAGGLEPRALPQRVGAGWQQGEGETPCCAPEGLRLFPCWGSVSFTVAIRNSGPRRVGHRARQRAVELKVCA